MLPGGSALFMLSKPNLNVPHLCGPKAKEEIGMLREFKLCIVLFLLCAVPANAQMTPNHVFQVTERSIQLLEDVNKANFSTPNYPSAGADPAQPRHVLQLARDVWRKTQLLRFMNGLTTYALEPVPARSITPADVKQTVDKIYEQLVGVLPAYGIEQAPEEPPLPTGKTPSDVFGNLLRLSAALDSLGVPSTVPNDVHQIAETVLQDALRLAELSRIQDPTSVVGSMSGITGKTPKDAFSEAVSLLKEIETLSRADASLAIKGGVSIPNIKENVTPSDVIIVLLRARAELNAMRVAMNDTTVSVNAPYQGGKTPSDVVSAVKTAKAVVERVRRGLQG